MSTKTDWTDYKFATRAIHAGQEPDPTTGAVVTPISLSTTYRQQSPGVHKGYDYSRSINPTREAWEACVASIENGKYGVAFASGLAATTTVAHLLKAGDHVVAMSDCYGGTFRYFARVASKFGLETSFVDFTVEGALEGAIKPNTRLIWTETPTNPTLRVCDLKWLAKVSKAHSCILVVDNTFATPYCQNPLDYGADLVLHSATKYLNGHSDVVHGVVVVNDEKLYKELRFLQNAMGAVPGPMDCWLCLRGVKTLHVRMQAHEKNAYAVAEYLVKHPKVEKVLYPGLPSHPQYDIVKAQMRCAGGMVSFYIKGDLKQTRQFMENLIVFALAESLGAVESLANHPAIMTHASIPYEERQKIGVTDNLVRLSVGIEDVADLIKDLEHAFSFVN